MRWTYRCQGIGIIGGLLAVLLFGPNALAKGPKTHKYRGSEIDMPVSLAVGTVRTPEFPVIHEAYFIMIQTEKRLPFVDQQCMMGLMSGPLDIEKCNNKEQLLQAEWTVWDDGKIVSRGSSSGWGPASYTNENIFKFLGTFVGEAKKKYVVEVKFTKDGTPLNVTNPHLIVILIRKH